jgi:uncharacterized protein (DUF58 family)
VRQLTVRGRCFAAAGVAAIVCGIQIGERDFVRIGLVALLVPLVAWLLLRRTRREVWVRRTLGAHQVEAGGSTEVSLMIGNDQGRTASLLLREELPPGLGASPTWVVDPMGSGEQTTLRYLIRARQRGRYPVGPLHIHAGDPTGMVDLHEVVPSTASLLVTPRTEPLPRIAFSGRWAGAGDDRTRDLLGAGSPDVTVREYRMGDDLRRIHWPTSARTDQLMVRREEQPWQARCTLVIDNRRISHRGYGAGGSMETAVRATASIARHLVSQDFEVRLVTATGESSAQRWAGSPAADLPAHLERLALMGLSRQEHLATTWVDESQQGGMLLAVLGHLDQQDTEFLAGLAAAGASAYAVVLDVHRWERDGRAQAPATADLRSRGWKAATLGPDASLAAAWQELAR